MTDFTERRPHHLGGVGRRYDYRPILHLLGKRPDMELARRVGCGYKEINDLRRRLEIPRFDPLAAHVHLLGKLSDVDVAKRAGVNPRTVQTRRRSLGIAPASRKRANADKLLREYVATINKELSD